MLTWRQTRPKPAHLPLFIGRLPSLPLAGFFLGLLLTLVGGSWLVEEVPPAGAWTWAESIRYTRIRGVKCKSNHVGWVLGGFCTDCQLLCGGGSRLVDGRSAPPDSLLAGLITGDDQRTSQGCRTTCK